MNDRPLATALLGQLSNLVSSSKSKDLAIVTPFLPLIQTQLLAQSEEDIRKGLEGVRGFIDEVF